MQRSDDMSGQSERLAACENMVCDCRSIVQRAYREMIGNGCPDQHALEAATVVLRWHHPDVAVMDAAEIVGRWVATGPLH